MRLLLIEDDQIFAQTLNTALSEQHYVVDMACDGEEGWDYAQAFTYDLILMDISLPKLDGISLCHRLRRAHFHGPIILLTAKDNSDDIVTGLDAGADDYVVKPCTIRELMARIRAVLRRKSESGTPILSWGNLSLDPSACQVTYQDTFIPLSPKEYSLLELFLRHPRRVLRRSAILEHLWSFEDPPGENTIRAHIKGLRRKLKEAGAEDIIETVYGIGYRLKAQPETTVTEAEITKEEKTQAAVNKAWERFKGSIFKRIGVLEQAIIALEADNSTPTLLNQAQQQAHKLVGSLGMFGFDKGSLLAKEIENWFLELPHSEKIHISSIANLKQLVESLNQELRLRDNSNPSPDSSIATTTLVPRKTDAQPQPLLLVIDDDNTLTQQLLIEGKKWNLQVETALTIEEGRQAIASQVPDFVLLDLAFPNDDRGGLTLLEELNIDYPQLPVFVFSVHNNFPERLEVARLGGKGFFGKPISAAQILEAVQASWRRNRPHQEKILAVDDDPVILGMLGEYLTNWDVQLTTLDDPRQFWEKLTTTNPDLLILDVEMPHVNGIELCQVVRNDPQWHSLPIIFLTARRNPETMYLIYEAGADDYINKPITEPELVNRIFNRLERNYLLRSLSEVDQLTGVANRHSSIKELNRYLQLSQSYGQPLCLGIVNIDNLSQINNQYGHGVGDRILKRMGQLLRQRFRGEDVIARWQGAQFVVAMYGMYKHDGAKRLNELLNLFTQEVFSIADKSPLQVTFSAGVGEFPTDGRDLLSLYQGVEYALNQAKVTGGNRILEVN